jgi:hypothetical protein
MTKQEIKKQKTIEDLTNLINKCDNIETKKKLEQLLKKMSKIDEVIVCSECGFNYNKNGKTRHYQSKKHLETVRTGVQYIPITRGFLKKKDELDPETYKKKQEWYRNHYKKLRNQKNITKDTCEKTI